MFRNSETNHCLQKGTAEVCNDFTNTGVVSYTAAQKHFQSENGNVEVSLGHVEAKAFINKNKIDLGWGLSLAQISGDVWMPEFKLGEKTIKMNVGLTLRAGVGAGVKLVIPNREEQHLNTKIGNARVAADHIENMFQGSVGLGPFKLIITAKDTTQEVELPQEFTRFIQEQIKPLALDTTDFTKGADQWFRDYLAKNLKKEISEKDLQEFVTTESEKFLQKEGEMFEHVEELGANLKKSETHQGENYFEEMGEGLHAAGVMLHLAGNRQAGKWMGLGQLTASMPKLAATASQGFKVVGGLFSGSVAFSMGSALSVVSGLGAVATIGSTLQYLLSDNDKDDYAATIINWLQPMLSAVLHNQEIMNQKLDVLNTKSDKIIEINQQIFFTQQLNHKELVDLLTEHFTRMYPHVYHMNTVLGQSYSLISAESAELRGMFQEERYAVIQELHEIVKSKLLRKISTLEKFLEEDFDTFYKKAKVAISGNTLTTGGRPCDSENINSLLTHFKNLRHFSGIEDFHSVFNTINLIQECLLTKKDVSKLNNLIGIHIQIDILLQITSHLIKHGKKVKELLPEMDDYINHAQQDINKIKKFTKSIHENQVSSKLFRLTKEALSHVQSLVKIEKAKFENRVNKKIDDSFTALLAAEKVALDNELIHLGELHFPSIWQKPFSVQDMQQLNTVNLGSYQGYEGYINDAVNRHRWESIRNGFFPGVWLIKMISLNWLKNFSPELHKAVENQQGLTYPVSSWKNEKLPGVCGPSWCATRFDYLRWRNEGGKDNYVADQIKRLGFEGHNEALYLQLVSLGCIDFPAKLREKIHLLHQQNLDSCSQSLNDQHSSFSLAIDGEALTSKNFPVLQLVLPSEKFNSGKGGPPLLLPQWFDWQKMFPEWMSAEQFGYGRHQHFYQLEQNYFVIKFQFKTIKDKVYDIGEFRQNLDEVICHASYTDVEKVYYYWNGGIYCYAPSMEKMAYVGLSGNVDHLHSSRFAIHIFDYPKFDVFPGHRNKSEVASGFKKSEHYGKYVTEMSASGNELLKKLRLEFNAEFDNAILQQLPPGIAITNFEFYLRMLHHVLLQTAPDSFVAKETHEKLLKIAKTCDRQGIREFASQYQGGDRYLGMHTQQCIEDLNLLETEYRNVPVTDGYLVTEIQEKIFLLKNLVENSEGNILDRDPKEDLQTNSASPSRSTPIWSYPFFLITPFASADKSLENASHDTQADTQANSWFQSIKDFLFPPDNPDIHFKPVSTEPASLDGNIMLALCALPFIKRFLPWCKETKLSEAEVHQLKEIEKKLQTFERDFPSKHVARVKMLGLPTTKFSDLKQLIENTKTLTEYGIQHKKLSSADFFKIKNNINRIQELQIKLFTPEMNRFLKKETRKEEIRQERSSRRSAKSGRIMLTSQTGFFAKQNLTLFPVIEQLAQPRLPKKDFIIPAGARMLR